MKIAFKPYQNLKVIGLILFFVLHFYGGVEVNFLIFCVGIIVFWKFKINKQFIHLISPLILLTLIGGLSGILHRNGWYNIFKDLIFFLKPILGMWFGFLFAKRMKSTKDWLQLIVYSGLGFSFIHFFQFFNVFLIYGFKVSDIRNNTDLDNYLEVFSFLTLLYYKNKNLVFFSEKRDKFFLVIISISILLYLSRSMILVSLILSLLLVWEYSFKIKYLVIFSILLVTGIVFLGYLQTLDLSISSSGLESFLYKIRMAPSELFFDETQNTSFRYLYDHWRGYEAYLVLEGIDVRNILLGSGFGALLDLRGEFYLGRNLFRFIPIIHNGYVFMLFKTGVIGLSVFFLFLINSYKLLFWRKSDSMVLALLAMSIISFWIFSTFIVTGIHNQGEFISVLFGGFVARLLSTGSLKDHKLIKK